MGRGGLKGNLEELIQQAPTTMGIYDEYLKQYVLLLRRDPELASAFYEVITAINHVKLEPVSAYKLQSMGLVHCDGHGCVPGCELYRLYFRAQLNSFEDVTMTNKLVNLHCANRPV